LTVSYGTITSDDTDYMLILDDLNFSGSIFTINPSFSYFVKDNLSFGARFGYSKTDGHIDNAALDLGEANDMNISFSDINLNSTSSSFGIFMRSYAGIDAKGHFGLFAELEGVDIYSAPAVALATLIKSVRDGRIAPEEYVMLNVTGGGEKRFMEGKELFFLKPSHVFDIDPDPKEVAEKVEALFE